MPKNKDFQRASEAPLLPTGTIHFIMHCLARFKGWIILMLIMETGQATGNIWCPMQLNQLWIA